MRQLICASFGASILVWGAAAAAADIQVMTQNQYLGANLAPVIAAAGGDGDFNVEVVKALRQIAANRAPERIRALANEILERRPELVALQEVWKFECGPFPGVPDVPGMGCDDPSIRGAFRDHRALTLAALGTSYVAKAEVTDLNLQAVGPFDGIPFIVNGIPALLRVTDRDMILARSDIADGVQGVTFTCWRQISGDGCNYAVVVGLPDITLPGIGTFPMSPVERGYIAVDATLNGRDYRFVNTHLEVRDAPIPAFIQSLQMLELLSQVLPTDAARTLIVAGDLNSDPNEPAPEIPPWLGLPPLQTPYHQALGAGLFDGWLLRPGSVAGLTCCQAENLANLPSLLTQRIDHVFLREMPSRVQDARVVGATANYRLAPQGRGLWPSDHGAVATKVFYR